jgi:hypothetical protein
MTARFFSFAEIPWHCSKEIGWVGFSAVIVKLTMAVCGDRTFSMRR